MTNDELLKLANERYPPGTKYINPCGVIDGEYFSLEIGDKSPVKVAKISKNNEFMEFKPRISSSSIGIKPFTMSNGYVYVDGVWGDIVDDNNIVIKSFNCTQGLNEVREWLYKED